MYLADKVGYSSEVPIHPLCSILDLHALVMTFPPNITAVLAVTKNDFPTTYKVWWYLHRIPGIIHVTCAFICTGSFCVAWKCDIYELLWPRPGDPDGFRAIYFERVIGVWLKFLGILLIAQILIPSLMFGKISVCLMWVLPSHWLMVSMWYIVKELSDFDWTSGYTTYRPNPCSMFDKIRAYLMRLLLHDCLMVFIRIPLKDLSDFNLLGICTYIIKIPSPTRSSVR